MNKVFSDFFSLNLWDIAKGAITAVLSSVVLTIYNLISDGTLPTGEEWRTVAVGALATFLGYMIKNLFSNSEGTVAKTEQATKTSKVKTMYSGKAS